MAQGLLHLLRMNKDGTSQAENLLSPLERKLLPVKQHQGAIGDPYKTSVVFKIVHMEMIVDKDDQLSKDESTSREAVKHISQPIYT